MSPRAYFVLLRNTDLEIQVRGQWDLQGDIGNDDVVFDQVVVANDDGEYGREQRE